MRAKRYWKNMSQQMQPYVGVSNFFLGGGTSFLYLHAIRSRSGGGTSPPPPHVKFPAWGDQSPPHDHVWMQVNRCKGIHNRIIF